jgi:hypothetical protein
MRRIVEGIWGDGVAVVRQLDSDDAEVVVGAVEDIVTGVIGK